MNPALERELELFVYREADLLDDRRFEEWLKLLTDDIVYWVPNFERDGDPGEVGVIVYEGMSGLRARIARALHDLNPVQKPPPRTRHFLTNVVVSGDGNGAAEVASNLLLYVSKGKRLTQYPGKSEYKLRKTDGSWRIAQKKVNLLSNDLPLSQLPLL
jgi:3-phenylpropionate/cinnamic acid dioxygenase small subunit